MFIEKPSLGLRILSVMEMPHSTVRLAVDVVSAISVPTEALVLYNALIFRSLSITSPLNLTELPFCMVKSLLAMPNATK